MAVKTFLLLMACFLAGALTPIQAGFNFRLAKAVNNTISAALISFLVGTVILLAYLAFTKQLKLDLVTVAKTEPFWVWLGGVIGAFFVVTLTFVVPKVGASLSFSLIIAGQLIISIIIDHYGLLGVPVTPINMKRIAGILLLVLAIWLIKEKNV